jgi:hypothetical protein
MNPSDEQNTQDLMQDVLDGQGELPPEFLPRLRRKIHARAVTVQAVEFSWSLPTIAAMTMVEVFSHVITSTSSSRRQ